MYKQFLFIFSLSLLTCFLVQAQSEEEIKIKGIKTKQTWMNISSTKKYLDKVEKFDSYGNIIELTEYREDKTIKNHLIWTYNANNNKLTEIELDESDNQLKKTVYEYDGILRISKKEYNEKGKLVDWKSYTYETK